MLKKLSLFIIIFCCFSQFALAQSTLQESPQALRKYDPQQAALNSLKAQMGENNKLITLTLKDADLKQALRMIANKANLNIAFDSSVNDVISLDFKKITLLEAIEQIAEVNNLELNLKKGTLLVKQVKEVCPSDTLKPQPIKVDTQIIKTVKVNYANAFDINDFLNTTLEQENNLVSVAQGLNEVVLIGSKNSIKKAEEIISKLDVEPKVAVFKLNYISPEKMARMICSAIFNKKCDIAEDSCFTQNIHPYSISYDKKQNSITILGATQEQLKLIQDYIKNTDIKHPQAILDILMVELNQDGIAQLEELKGIDINYKDGAEYGVNKSNKNLLDNIGYIASNSGGKILARPKVTISNDSKYEIKITSDYIESKQNAHVYNIAKDCGIDLKIQSIINPKREVILDLAPTYQSVKQFIPTEKRAKATLLNRKSIKVENIRLNNCETLALGGMSSQREFKRGFLGLKKETKNIEFMIFVHVQLLD